MEGIYQFKPKLIACECSQDSRLVHLKARNSNKHLTLPVECFEFLKWFDGNNSIEEVILKEFSTHSKISLKNLFTALNRLSDEDFFVAKIPDGLIGKTKLATAEIDNKKSFFAKSLFDFTLLQNLKLGFLNAPGIASILLWLNFAFGIWGFYYLFNDKEILNTPFLFDSVTAYQYAIPKLFILSSLLLTYKYLLRTLVQLIAFGHAVDLQLRVFLVGVCFATSEYSLQKNATDKFKNLFYLSTPLSHLALVGIISAFGFESTHFGDLKIVALFMAFTSLNPLRRSDFTDLVERHLSAERIKHFIPYLKGRALLALFRKGAPIEGENSLLIFSSLAVLWVVCFLDFAVKLLGRELPNLQTALSSNISLSWGSALLVLVLVVGSLLSLTKDVLSVFIQHLTYPFAKLKNAIGDFLYSHSKDQFDNNEISALIEKTWLFEGYSKAWIHELIKGSKVQVFRNSSEIIHQDDPATAVYLLLKGNVEVIKTENSGFEDRLAILGEGAVFGEMALLSNAHRRASVRAKGKCEALRIPVDVFNKLFAKESAAQTLVDKIALGQYLASSLLFSKLPEESMIAMSSEGQFLRFQHGNCITEQGAMEQDLYLIVRGKVEIQVDGKIRSTLSQGSFFGEISLFTKKPRAASAIAAANEVLVFKLTAQQFFKVLAKNPSLGTEIEEIAHDRKDDLQW